MTRPFAPGDLVRVVRPYRRESPHRDRVATVEIVDGNLVGLRFADGPGPVLWRDELEAVADVHTVAS